MRVINHNWSARKQRLHPQSVAEISRHLVLSGDRIRQCGTSSRSRQKDTDQYLQLAISFCKHRSVPVPCGNGSAEITVAEGGRNPVARLWGHTLGENWPPEPTSSYASINFWCQQVASPATAVSWMSVGSNGGLRISGWIGQLSCLTIFSTSLSVAAFLCKAGGSMLESTGSHGRIHWKVTITSRNCAITTDTLFDTWPEWWQQWRYYITDTFRDVGCML